MPRQSELFNFDGAMPVRSNDGEQFVRQRRPAPMGVLRPILDMIDRGDAARRSLFQRHVAVKRREAYYQPPGGRPLPAEFYEGER